jgi:hypothetical protein
MGIVVGTMAVDSDLLIDVEVGVNKTLGSGGGKE